MAVSNFRLESGIQMLARLTKKPEIKNFYPNIFQCGPNYGEVIEIFSDISMSNLLTDIICEALIPGNLGGTELSIILFSTDGNLNYDYLLHCLQIKLCNRMNLNSINNEELQNQLLNALRNLHILKIYDATQFYTTIHNIERILLEHPNISIVIFDTLTAFYWSEQGLKIMKMDLYLKNLIQLIHKITKDYKITTFYTRPEHFSSSKDAIENLESCCEFPKPDKLNYRIQLLHKDENNYQVNVRSFSTQFRRYFSVEGCQITWINLK